MRSISFDLEWTDSEVLNLLLAYSSVMSSKLTELTESSPSATPPSVLCGSGVPSQLASSGHFDPSQDYDGYNAVEVLDPACTECLAKGKDCFNITIPDLQSVTIVSLERSHVVVPGCKLDRKSTRLNSSHSGESRMPSSA